MCIPLSACFVDFLADTLPWSDFRHLSRTLGLIFFHGACHSLYHVVSTHKILAGLMREKESFSTQFVSINA